MPFNSTEGIGNAGRARVSEAQVQKDAPGIAHQLDTKNSACRHHAIPDDQPSLGTQRPRCTSNDQVVFPDSWSKVPVGVVG